MDGVTSLSPFGTISDISGDFCPLNVDTSVLKSFVKFGEFTTATTDKTLANNQNSECAHSQIWKPPPSKYVQHGINYNSHTTHYYKTLRQTKRDPITNDLVDEKLAFRFKYRWDPYTGERLDEDPYGPLLFDCDNLIKHFYETRLNNLWVKPVDDGAGFQLEGYYDDGLGAGEEFHIQSRGHHPERYCFRLPIPDCYLSVDHTDKFITFGPKLTDQEIEEIEKLANKSSSNYRKAYGKNRPSLTQMKRFYDAAISQRPEVTVPDGTDAEGVKMLYYQYNVNAVKSLINMSG